MLLIQNNAGNGGGVVTLAPGINLACLFGLGDGPGDSHDGPVVIMLRSHDAAPSAPLPPSRATRNVGLASVAGHVLGAPPLPPATANVATSPGAQLARDLDGEICRDPRCHCCAPSRQILQS